MPAKLLVVAGPNRGATYFLEEGEMSFGRSPEAQIVLASTQVSKKHFAIVGNGRKLELRDLGSSNGTYINGVLTKKKLLKNGDRISAGPFVLEVVVPEVVAPPPAMEAGEHTFTNVAAPQVEAGQFKLEQEEPKSLVGKYKKKFDDIFLPVLFDFYERTEFANLIAIMFAVYSLINLGFTVYPVLQRSREEVLRQAEHQARYISQQVAQLNRQAIIEDKEAALITEFAEMEPNVREVVVSTLEGRIKAPGARLNEAYSNPLYVKYMNDLKRNSGLWGRSVSKRVPDREEIYVFTPIMVMSKTKGFNVPAAIATVIYSTTETALDSGTIATVYLEALFWSGLLGLVFIYLLLRVSSRPLEKLNDDMDRVLKGEGDAVEKKYRNEGVDQLIDTVNSALGRIPRSDATATEEAAGGDQERLIIDNMMQSLEFLATKAGHPMMTLDLELRIKLANESFEELTGIRGGQGEVIDAVSRDESFPALIKELTGKSIEAGNEGAVELYDFASGAHNVRCVALAGIPGRVEAYLFLFEKEE